jgi:hypothetical protein
MAGGCVFDVKVGSIWMLKNSVIHRFCKNPALLKEKVNQQQILSGFPSKVKLYSCFSFLKVAIQIDSKVATVIFTPRNWIWNETQEFTLMSG